MFADALLDSHRLDHSRRGWATLTSFGLQAIALVCLLIVPLFYTQVLPHLPSMSTIVAPLGSPAPIRPSASTQPAGSGPSIYVLAHLNGLVLPHPVPHGDSLDPSVNPPDVPFGGIGTGNGSNNPGIPGIWGGTGTAAPPVIPQRPTPVHPRISAMMEGSLIHRVEPIYPSLARTARVQGAVVIAAVIGKDGMVERLQVVSGHPLLIQAAIDAVRQWRYRPYILNGAPIEVDTQITVNFILAR